MKLVLLACLFAVSTVTGFEIVLGLPLRNLAKLESNFWAISTPGHPEYLNFASRHALSALIGADDASIANASSWLTSFGAHSVSVSPLRDAVTADFEPLAQPRSWIPLNNHPSVRFDYILRRDAKPNVAISRVQAMAAPNGGYSIANQKKAYGIPVDLTATNSSTLQMVWGPGTFGYSASQLSSFKQEQVPLLNMDKIRFDTENHGRAGGDNYGEGNLDTQMITAFGLNVSTVVSNTNTSASTEEGKGFGQAMLDFLTQLAGRETVPHVLSLSLGSLSAHSCNMLCEKATSEHGVSPADCNSYLQQQRQVCMYMSEAQESRINTALQVLGTRGVTIFGSSGDGGSHFSFQRFSGGKIADVLNQISCEYQMPVWPSSSPYVISVGGTAGSGLFRPDLSKPKAWSGSGGGFSWEFPAAAFQKDAIQAYLSSAALPPAASYNASGRGYPDISALAVEGTSQSSPIVAGVFSLLIDGRLNKGLPGLGFLGPRLYKAMADHPGTGFIDVTSGDSSLSCDNGFPSHAGWDPVTGWGQPLWGDLVKLFGSD